MQVITFLDYTPAARFDGEPWTEVDVEEGDSVDGPFSVIETIALVPLDADPSEPETRSLTTDQASDTMGLWYRLVFRDADGGELQATDAVQNLAGETTYASVNELARILKIRTPSDAQRIAMARVLTAAAAEIDHEVARPDDDPLGGRELALAAQVNLQRAAELWGLQEWPLGLAGIGSEFGTSSLARNSWDKYVFTLAPLKRAWGIA